MMWFVVLYCIVSSLAILLLIAQLRRVLYIGEITKL